MFTCLFALFGWSEAGAQNTTGTIRGRVLDEAGAPVADAQVVARNAATNVERTTVSNAQGLYMLVGLPPASYELSVNVIGYSAAPRTVRVLIGQTLAVDLQLQPQAIVLEGITAVGERVYEVKTPEIATNVTEEQIRSLPQADRNFLNFAALAPGLTVSRQETNKQITAGGLPATKINVFVDGASYKNDVLEGGVHGQDASRGNPFPQIALQEFRVITQNFKAEYQRAASAVVTATTRSGTNDFRLNGFVLGQNKGLVEQNPGVELDCAQRRENDPNATCPPKPEYEQLQLGIAAGGPIQRDKLFYFAAFEGNYQNREAIVSVGREEFRSQFAQYEGTFDQPFRSSLGVAKLSWVPAANQTLDLSWNGRFETDKRNFGGTTSFESAENVKIGFNVVTLQHSMTMGDWFNQAHISGQRSTWNPTVVNEAAGVGLNYDGIIRTGGRDTEQKFVQDRIALRNDLSRSGIRWNGSHAFKMGVNVDFLNYDVQKRFGGIPVFTFVFDPDRPTESMQVPVRAHYGSGDPGMDENNVQFGVYIQDDWDVSDRLQLNLGVRWDAETNQFNNKWVTPDSIRQRFAGLGYENRFTDGTSDRPMYLGAFQPRVGFSYDVLGDARTVVHGGFGIYYDREIWNHLIDERFRLQWIRRNFNFTTDPTDDTRILWGANSSLSADYLEAIVAQGTQPITNEVFLLDNDTKPPRSHQWSLGVRQMVSQFAVGAAYRGVRGYNLLSWYCGMPHPDHGFCEGGRQTAGLPYDPVLSTDEGRTWYDALDLTVEKPYTQASRWGFTLGYTYADAERKGQEFFTLDHPGVDPADWPRRNAAVEKHRITASGIVGLPYEFQLSTLAQWGSGTRFSRIVEPDHPFGWGLVQKQVDWFSETGDAFRQVDLRLEKRFVVPGTPGRVGLEVHAINVFDHDNYREYWDLASNAGGPIANFGEPKWFTADPGRRLQLGLNFEF
ncbi:MAG TPA: TonB-dependent receptor [Longimicrobiales bacterium]|nr:TonB-dependent receptor [Longimicrobiales bacterium]